MRDDERVAAWWQELTQGMPSRAEAVHAAYQTLDNAGVISKVAVHRYICEPRGHPLMTVIRVGDDVIARSRDNQLSRGLNDQVSVPSARAKNTLDGHRHWPGHTFDVLELVEWGAAIDLTCRHRRRTIAAHEVLDDVGTKLPGHAGAPTRL